jgi:acid phosphatase
MRSVLALTLAAEAVLAASSSAVRPTASVIEPALTQILATQATAPALSPVSDVKGAGFDRFVQIWLENTV